MVNVNVWGMLWLLRVMAGHPANHGNVPDVTLVSPAPPPSEALDDLCWRTCLDCRGCCPYTETVGVEGLWIEASSLVLAAKQIPETQQGKPFTGCQAEQRFHSGVVRHPVVEVLGHGCVGPLCHGRMTSWPSPDLSVFNCLRVR